MDYRKGLKEFYLGNFNFQYYYSSRVFWEVYIVLVVAFVPKTVAFCDSTKG